MINTELEISAENLASFWLARHPSVSMKWKKELTTWLNGWMKNNPEFQQYIDQDLQSQDIREQVKKRIINSTKRKIENEYSQNTILKKGWLKQYKKSDSYQEDLNKALEEDREYLLLCTDTYEQSKAYQIMLEEQRKKKKTQFCQEVERLVNDVLVVRVDSESREYIKSKQIREAIENLVLHDTVMERMEKHLTSERVKGLNGRVPAQEREVQDLIKNYPKCLKRGRLTAFMNGHTTYAKYVYEKLASKNKKLKLYAALSPELVDDLQKALEEEYHLNHRMNQIIKECVTEDWMIQCLLKNSIYQHTVEKILRVRQYERYIESGILDRIPEQYEDLYPLARTMKRHFILHIGPTNSGKTYEAMQAFRNAKMGVYLAPLRLMAYEAYEESNRLNCPCHMHTGEEEIVVEGATHTSCTIELADYVTSYDVCVIDEAQMLSDESRGGAWTSSILGMRANEIHICAAESAKNILIRLIQLCDDTYELIRHERAVPLVADQENFSFPANVRKNDALIVFSKRDVLRVAAELQKRDWKISIIYGSLPYETRQKEVAKFRNRETDIVVATDAIGMGMNLPVERIVFLQTEKFDGKQLRSLKEQEFKQIAGRAGRRGLYEIGYYTSEFDKNFVIQSIQEPCKSIKQVYLDFPENLLGIDSKLSDILAQWMKMPAKGIFWKQDINTMIGLAVELEALSDDKNLIYHFITIPFDETNSVLHRMWKKIFLMHINQETVTVLDFLDTEREFSQTQLDDLELEYKKSDLLYNYLRKFSVSEEKSYVLAYKKHISEQISEVLAMQKLPLRRCAGCGCQLSWNFPYKYCTECYEKMGI